MVSPWRRAAPGSVFERLARDLDLTHLAGPRSSWLFPFQTRTSPTLTLHLLLSELLAVCNPSLRFDLNSLVGLPVSSLA